MERVSPEFHTGPLPARVAPVSADPAPAVSDRAANPAKSERFALVWNAAIDNQAIEADALTLLAFKLAHTPNWKLLRGMMCKPKHQGGPGWRPSRFLGAIRQLSDAGLLSRAKHGPGPVRETIAEPDKGRPGRTSATLIEIEQAIYGGTRGATAFAAALYGRSFPRQPKQAEVARRFGISTRTIRNFEAEKSPPRKAEKSSPEKSSPEKSSLRTKDSDSTVGLSQDNPPPTPPDVEQERADARGGGVASRFERKGRPKRLSRSERLAAERTAWAEQAEAAARANLTAHDLTVETIKANVAQIPREDANRLAAGAIALGITRGQIKTTAGKVGALKHVDDHAAVLWHRLVSGTKHAALKLPQFDAAPLSHDSFGLGEKARAEFKAAQAAHEQAVKSRAAWVKERDDRANADAIIAKIEESIARCVADLETATAANDKKHIEIWGRYVAANKAKLIAERVRLATPVPPEVAEPGPEPVWPHNDTGVVPRVGRDGMATSGGYGYVDFKPTPR